MKYIKQFMINDIVLDYVPSVSVNPRQKWQGPADLSPLLVAAVGDTMVLVDGYRRLEALKREELSCVDVLVLEHDVLPENLFEKAFRSNAAHLDVCEYLHVLYVLRRQFSYSDEDVCELFGEYVPHLLTPRDLSNICRAYFVFDQAGDLLLEKTVSLEQVVRLLDHVKGADFERWLDLLVQTGMNQNELKNMLKYGSDVIRRDGCTWYDIWMKLNVSELIQEEDRRVRLKSVMQAMIGLRFPIRTQSEQDIQKIYQSLGSPSQLQIKLPENLEGSTVHVQLSVETVEEMFTLMEWLQTKKEILDDLFQWI